jgi:hypothetical protein
MTEQSSALFSFGNNRPFCSATTKTEVFRERHVEQA